MVKKILLISGLAIGCRVNTAFIRIPSNTYLEAHGNEPGWVLTVQRNRAVLLVNNYGQDTIRLNGRKDELLYSKYTVKNTEVERVYFPKEDLTIDVKHTPCRDDMSGKAFNKSIVIIHGGKTYRGCGNFKKKVNEQD